MIPTVTTYKAIYREPKADGGFYNYARDVEAWDDDGNALVVDEKAGKLVPANDRVGFYELQFTDGRYITALPADGWVAKFHTDKPEESFTEPLLCWLVEQDGTIAACSIDARGVTEVLTYEVRDSHNIVFGRAVTS